MPGPPPPVCVVSLPLLLPVSLPCGGGGGAGWGFFDEQPRTNARPRRMRMREVSPPDRAGSRLRGRDVHQHPVRHGPLEAVPRAGCGDELAKIDRRLREVALAVVQLPALELRTDVVLANVE